MVNFMNGSKSLFFNLGGMEETEKGNQEHWNDGMMGEWKILLRVTSYELGG